MNNEITKTMRRTSLPRLRRAVLRALQKPLHWRMKHQYFRLPFELWLLRARNRLVMRRSLLTGQSLGHSLAEIC